MQRGRKSTGENAVHPLGDVLAPSRVAAGNLGDAPAAEADFIQRFHDRRPVVVAFEPGNVEALPQAFPLPPLAPELFDAAPPSPPFYPPHTFFRPPLADPSTS